MSIARIFVRLYRIIAFVFYYLYELVVSSIYVAWDIVTPKDLMKPGIVEIPIDLKNNTAILAFANLASMTPGSLTLDMTPDKKKMYVHAMYLYNKDEFIGKMKGEMEKKIREIFE